MSNFHKTINVIFTGVLLACPKRKIVVGILFQSYFGLFCYEMQTKGLQRAIAGCRYCLLPIAHCQLYFVL
jgi:hypothetical protein